MVDVAVSAQLQQWTFEKPSVVRPNPSDSAASSPDLYDHHHDHDTLRLDTAAVDSSSSKMDTTDTISFQERYLSSEEDLSPMEGTSDSEDGDDDVSIHDFELECLSAKKISMARFENGKSCDMAVKVSYVSAGRPKMINLTTVASPVRRREKTQRSASLAQLPTAAVTKLRKGDQSARLSLRIASPMRRPVSPLFVPEVPEPRRPSTGHAPYSHNTSSLGISDSSSNTASSVRSSSPAMSEKSFRPQSAATMLYLATNPAPTSAPFTAFPPLTPQSPEPHSFLSSDPYETSTTSSASPIIKSGPHRRLRSISQRLSLAKIAITPTLKKWDSRVNGHPSLPPTPATPYTPMTPQSAPHSPPKSRLRRNSMMSRAGSIRGSSPETPPVPRMVQTQLPHKPVQRLVPRGADEREPMIELPPFPVDEPLDAPMGMKPRRVRKRKSLMDLLPV